MRAYLVFCGTEMRMVTQSLWSTLFPTATALITNQTVSFLPVCDQVAILRVNHGTSAELQRAKSFKLVTFFRHLRGSMPALSIGAAMMRHICAYPDGTLVWDAQRVDFARSETRRLRPLFAQLLRGFGSRAAYRAAAAWRGCGGSRRSRLHLFLLLFPPHLCQPATRGASWAGQEQEQGQGQEQEQEQDKPLALLAALANRVCNHGVATMQRLVFSKFEGA